LSDPVNAVDPEGLAFSSYAFRKAINAFAKSVSNFYIRDLDPAGRRIIGAVIGGAATGFIGGALLGGTPTLGIGALPASLAGGFIGFAGGLLNQTLLEVLGLGQPIEDFIVRIDEIMPDSSKSQSPCR
jgi:hypothetical protein